MGPNYVELGWLGRTFPDLVCLEGREVSGLAGPALHGWVAKPGGSIIEEQGIMTITISLKGQITLTSG